MAQLSRVKVIELPWAEVFQFLVKNPTAIVMKRIDDCKMASGQSASGLRFCLVPGNSGSQQEVWVPPGYEDKVCTMKYQKFLKLCG